MIMIQNIKINKKKSSCTGDIKNNLGHPKIYFLVNKEMKFICPYCNLQYEYVEVKSRK